MPPHPDPKSCLLSAEDLPDADDTPVDNELYQIRILKYNKLSYTIIG
jgi:hypothetical protein